MIDFLERLAVPLRTKAPWLAVVGGSGFLIFLTLVETNRAIGFAGGLAAIWCFGLYVIVELLKPSEPIPGPEGQKLISPIRMASSRLEYWVGAGFIVAWLLGTTAFTILFIRIVLS